MHIDAIAGAQLRNIFVFLGLNGLYQVCHFDSSYVSIISLSDATSYYSMRFSYSQGIIRQISYVCPPGLSHS
jgi:hypothetical protein